MIKKLLAFNLMLIMLLMSASSFADEFEISDNEESDVAVEFVTQLGFMELDADGLFLPNEFMSRRELAHLICKLMNHNILIEEFDEEPEMSPEFPDVDIYDPYYQAIKTAYQLNIMNGYSDGTFRPDTSITGEQFIKVLVDIWGFGRMANEMGGYPNGYFMAASMNKMLPKGYQNTGKPLNRKTIAEILYTALDAPVCKIEGNAIRYDETKDNTLLVEYHDIYKARGIINANEYTELGSKNSPTPGYIKIEGVEYSIKENMDVNSLLGQEIIYYYKYDPDKEDTPMLVYARPRKNTVVTVMCEDITSFSLDKLEYIESEKEKKSIRLTNITDYVLNNRSLTGEFSEEIINPQVAPDGKKRRGSVTFISYGDDSVADVVIMDYYETYVVSSLVKSDMIFYDLYGKAPLDLSDEKKVKIIRSEYGDVINTNTININNVLSVKKSIDGYVTDIIVSTRNVRGTISEKEITENGISIRIDGEWYKVAPDFAESDVFKTKKSGESAEFYIDAYGYVSAVSTKPYVGSDATVDFVYGYLMDVRLQEDNNFESRVCLKYLDVNEGGVKVSPIAKRISVDNIKYKYEQVDEIIDILKMKPAGTYDKYEQVFRYKRNAEGEITYIDTIAEDYGQDNDSQFRELTPMRSGAVFKTRPKSLVGAAIGWENTVIFQIPYQWNNKPEDEDYKILNFGNMVGDREYTVATYTSQKGKLSAPADVFVLYTYTHSGETVRCEGNPDYVLMKNPSLAVLPDGTQTVMLKVWNMDKGAEEELMFNQRESYHDYADAKRNITERPLRAGYTIQVNKDGNGRITQYVRIADLRTGDELDGSEYTHTSYKDYHCYISNVIDVPFDQTQSMEPNHVWGWVMEKNGNNITVMDKDPADKPDSYNYRIYNASQFSPVTYIDNSDEKLQFSKGDISMITDYDNNGAPVRVYVKTKWNQEYYMIIIKD